MSNLELITYLCQLLQEALQIIKAQAEIMEQHGVSTYDGSIERKRTELLEAIERQI